MARSCGIRIGTRRLELCVLDGSPKKPKLVAYRHAFPEPDEGTEDGAASVDWGGALKGLAKGAADGVSADTTGLCVDAGLAVYRHLSLPFAEKAKIEEVLKFEVESKIPQWDIDQTICDFHVVTASPVESHLLVSAVPKQALEERLAACSKAGLEPVDAELDATALFTAAEFAGLLGTDSTQLLVYLGDASATLVVASEGALASTRAFHFEPEAAPTRVATAAVGEEGDEPFERADDEDLLGQADARRRVHVTRLRREIARTLNSFPTEAGFTGIFICGLRAEELLAEPIAGVEVHALDALAEVAGAEEVEDRLAAVVTFGAALRRLGYPSAIKPHLRREDLAFAGTFERLELPLGVLSLLLVTFLAAQLMITHDAIGAESDKLDLWARQVKVFMIGENPDAGDVRNAALTDPPATVKDYAEKMAQGDEADPSRDRYQELMFLATVVNGEIDALKEKLGAAEDASYPQSALWAGTLALDLIDELVKSGRIPRFGLRSFDSQYQPGSSRRPDRCEVTLDLTIWGETSVQSSQAYDALISELRAQEWIVDPQEIREPSRNTGEDGTSLILDGLRFFVDPGVAEARYLADGENQGG